MASNDKKLYIGIDPDLRLLNAAVVTSDREPLAVFARRNASGRGDTAVSAAALIATLLFDDILAFFSKNEHLQQYETVVVVESQSMQQAVQYRSKGRKIDYDDILHTGQMAGIMLGVFSPLATSCPTLVQPSAWKGQVPKEIHHERIYHKLGWFLNDRPKHIEEYSHDKINAGDYKDINDSLGLALYGAERGL